MHRWGPIVHRSGGLLCYKIPSAGRPNRARNTWPVPKRPLLGMFDAMPAYLGGKRQLLGPIFGAIARHLEISEWPAMRFVDCFSGGGSVSLYAKARFGHVFASDVSARAEIIAHAILCNNTTRLSKTDLMLFLAGASAEPFVETELADYFPDFTARIIDRGFAYAASVADPTKAALLRLLAWRIACESLPNSGANRSTPSKRLYERIMTGELSAAGVMRATFALRAPRLLDLARFAAATHKGIFHGDVTFERADAVQGAAGWHGDVWFIDPPYVGSPEYSTAYNIVDQVLRDKLEKGPYGKAKTAAPALEHIVESAYAAGAKVIVWCNSRSWEPSEQLALLGSLWPNVEEIEVKHKHRSASGIHGNAAATGATSAEKAGKNEFMAVAYR